MKKNTPYVYAICLIDKKYWKNINEDLKTEGYQDIKAFIPTVKILHKLKGGKQYFTEVPMLFNYGFIRMKSDQAFDRQFLLKLRRKIPGILNWLRSLETMHPKKLKRRVDNAEDFDDFSIVATISRKEYRYYKRISKKNQIYSKDDITKLNIGDYITLRCYPFEGMGAVIEDINLTTKTVTVSIYPEQGMMVVKIPIEHILYTIYENYDEDNFQASYLELDLSQIPDGSTEEYLTSKQF